MKVLLFAPASAAGLCAAAARTPETQPDSGRKPIEKKAEQVIPLYMSTDRMMMMLRISGAGPFPVVFDTGTDTNILGLGLANRLKLPNTGPSHSLDGNNVHLPGHQTFLKDATLSGVALDGKATANPYNRPDEVGVFGPSSFPGKVVRVEGVRSRVLVLPKNSETVPTCEANPYVEVGNGKLPSAVVEIGGMKITAEFDTGNNSAFMLPLTYMSKVPLEAPATKVGTSSSAAGTYEEVYGGRLTVPMTVGGMSVEHARVLFKKDGIPNIGLPLIRTGTMVLDPSAQRDWIFSQ